MPPLTEAVQDSTALAAGKISEILQVTSNDAQTTRAFRTPKQTSSQRDSNADDESNEQRSKIHDESILHSLQYKRRHYMDEGSETSNSQADDEDDEDEEEDEDDEDDEEEDAEETDGNNPELIDFRPSPGFKGKHSPSGSVSRDVFRNHLRETEGPTDLQLLYPHSLINGNGSIDSNIESTFISTVLSPLKEAEITGSTTTSNSSYRELNLKEFCIYRGLRQKRFRGQFESLHIVFTDNNKKKFLIDGTISQGSQHASIEGATIVNVRIGGLGGASTSCEGQVWIQTKTSSAANDRCWYKLIDPHASYQKIWSDFVWIANFSKYCIDYIVRTETSKGSVTLKDFAADFKKRISEIYGVSPAFKIWDRQSYYQEDFRRQMALYGRFVYDQCRNLKYHNGLGYHLWNEIGLFKSETVHVQERTVVTKNVARTFVPSLPGWEKMFQETECTPTVENKRQDRMRALKIPNKFGTDQDIHFRIDRGVRISRVEWTLAEASQRNDPVKRSWEELSKKLVVIRQHDEEGYHFDFALVKEVARSKKHVRVIWLTLPSKTICARSGTGNGKTKTRSHKSHAFYPIGNELFFSDDCNCYTVRTSNIYGAYDISVGSLPKSDNCKFFVISQYQEKEQCFVNPACISNRTCMMPCLQPKNLQFGVGRDSARRRRNNPKKQTSPINCGGYKPEDFLPNVSLFTGSGLFDRALESGGVIRTMLSIDCNPIAMCSARANCKHSVGGREHRFVDTSINEVLQMIMSGKEEYLSTGCLSAGSPCPGFSIANRHRGSERSLRDCSLLAGVMSWIEILLPQYAVIENVPTMDSGSPSACCQAVSFLVALGYQVRKVLLKAKDYGGSTIRSRLFIVAAAPSCTLPCWPEPPNGSEGALEPYNTIEDTISDLDAIHNDTLVNVREPYHIPSRRLQPMQRSIIHHIPRNPPGMGLVDSLKYLTDPQKEWFESLSEEKRAENSQTMRRVKADEQFRSVVTKIYWQCAIQGRVLHYQQDRVLSLEELARAQGVPSDFVLVGSMSQQLRQIGNAVPWCLGAAIGNEISKAFLLSQNPAGPVVGDRHETSPIPISVETTQQALSDSGEDDDECRVISEVEYRESRTRSQIKSNSSSSVPDRSYSATEATQKPDQTMKRPHSRLRDTEFEQVENKRIRLERCEDRQQIEIMSEDSANDDNDDDDVVFLHQRSKRVHTDESATSIKIISTAL